MDSTETVTLANWRRSPWNRWAFHHVSELVPVAMIPTDPSRAKPLPEELVVPNRLSDGSSIDQVLRETETDGFLVLRDGALIYEWYANGLGADMPHIVFSISKSISAILAGILVGQAQDERILTGVSVVLPERPAVCAVDWRGGAPGSRETDALAPEALVEAVDAVVLAGGSVYGLGAADGVCAFLGAQGRGYRFPQLAASVPAAPVIPAAILFDLANGGDKAWGEEPPYHVPVFVLTNHPRDPIVMKGGTVFHFVTDGAEAALDRAREAAGGKDVRIGGGAATVRQYLEARAIDELHVAVAPILLGRGEPLWRGLDLAALGYKVAESVAGEKANHLIVDRQWETAQ